MSKRPMYLWHGCLTRFVLVNIFFLFSFSPLFSELKLWWCGDESGSALAPLSSATVAHAPCIILDSVVHVGIASVLLASGPTGTRGARPAAVGLALGLTSSTSLFSPFSFVAAQYAPGAPWPRLGRDNSKSSRHPDAPLTRFPSWTYPVGNSMPAIGPDGSVFVPGGGDNKLHAIQTQGRGAPPVVCANHVLDTCWWNPLCDSLYIYSDRKFRAAIFADLHGTLQPVSSGVVWFILTVASARLHGRSNYVSIALRLFAVVGSLNMASGYDATSSWPRYLKDSRGTASSATTAARHPSWSVQFGDYVWASPAVMPDGNIVVATYDFLLHCIDAVDGREIWSFNVGHWPNSPALGPTGTIFITSYANARLRAVSSTGSQLWSYTAGASIVSSPALAGDGTCYFGGLDANLYAVNAAGSLKWTFATGLDIRSSPAVGSDGTIYVGSNDAFLYAINPTGTLKWTYATSGPIHSSPVIAADNSIIVGTNGDFLHSVSNAGSGKWTYGAAGDVQSSPAIGNGGVMYVGSRDGKLHAINPGGTGKWTYTTGSWVDSPPAVGNDGRIFVGSNDNTLYAINPDGSLSFSMATGGDIRGSPAIASDGSIYVGSFDGKLYHVVTYPLVHFEKSTYSVYESEISLNVTVLRDGMDTQSAFTVEVIVENGTAQGGGVDFSVAGVNTTITFSAGVTSINIPISIVLDDDYTEGNETFTLRLANIQPEGPAYIAHARNTTEVTIINTPYPYANSSWPRFGRDNAGTARSLEGEEQIVFRFPSWNVAMGDEVHSSPAVAGDGTVVVGSNDNFLHGVRPDGALAWQYGNTGGDVRSSPAIGGPGGSVAFVGSYGGDLHAVNTTNGVPLWTYGTAGFIFSSPVLGDGDAIVFVGSYDNNLHAVNAATGQGLWTFSGPADMHGVAAGRENVTYVGCMDNKLYAVDGAGAELWSFSTGGDILSAPALSPFGIYVATRASLIHALNLAGSERWSYATGGFMDGSPVFGSVADTPAVIVGSYDGNLYALGEADGTVLWMVATGGDIRGSALVASGVVYVGSFDSKLYAVAIDTGFVLWTYATGGPIQSSPALAADGSLYVGSNDFFLHHVVPYPLVLFSLGDVSGSEGSSAIITVLRDGMDVNTAFSVDVVFDDGTALGGMVDYNSTSATVHFGAGVTEVNVSVAIADDADFTEDGEVFTARLANIQPEGPAYIAHARNATTVTIEKRLAVVSVAPTSVVLGTPLAAVVSGGRFNATAAFTCNLTHTNASVAVAVVAASSASYLSSGSVSCSFSAMAVAQLGEQSASLSVFQDGAQIALAPAAAPLAIDIITTAPSAPAAPAASTAAFPATQQVLLSWTVPSAAARGGLPVIAYQVYRDGLPLGGPTAALSFVDAAAAENATYSYALAITTAKGTGPPSLMTVVATPRAGPALTAVSPSVAPQSGGTVVILTGTFFGDAPSDLVSVVWGVTSPTAATWGSSTHILVTVPPAAAAGSVAITVSTVWGTSPVLLAGFAYGAVPNITAVNPVEMGRTARGFVSIWGADLGLAPGDLASISLAGVPCAAIQWHNASVVSCVMAGTAPAAVSGPVLVATSSGGVSPPPRPTFSYFAAAVTSISPTQASATSATTITLLGSHLGDAVAVNLTLASSSGATHPCAPVVILDAGRITCVVAAGAPAGNYSVVVTTATGGATSSPPLLILSDPAASPSALPLPSPTLAPFPSSSSSPVANATNSSSSAVQPCSDPGVYLPPDAEACVPCPEGAECPGGARLWPLEGFWNEGEESGFVEACRPKERCVGGRDVGAMCAEGHEGPVCARCSDGFTHLQGLCVPCPPDAGVWAYIVGDILVWGFVAVAAWSLRSADDYQRVVAFVSVLQSAGQFSSLLTPAMPTVVLRVYDALDIFMGDYDIIKTDCLGHKPPFAAKFFGNLVYNFLIGSFMAFGCLAVRAVRVALARRRGDRERAQDLARFYGDRFRCSLTVWIQLVYVNLTRKAFEAVFCRPTPRAGHLVLDAYPAERCFAGLHAPIFAISLAIIAAVTVGWPAWYTLFLRRRTAEVLDSDAQFRHRWGNHFVLLKPERRFFFLWQYGTALALATAEVFAAASPQARVGIAGTAVFAHVMTVFRISPHLIPRDDWVLLSYEVPMLLLIAIGGAAELGTVAPGTLFALAIITLAILALCILFHFGDLVYHLALASPSAGGDKGIIDLGDDEDGCGDDDGYGGSAALFDVDIVPAANTAPLADEGGDVDGVAEPEEGVSIFGLISQRLWGLFPRLSPVHETEEVAPAFEPTAGEEMDSPDDDDTSVRGI